MLYSALLLFSLLLAPLLVQLRGSKPAGLFFAVAAVYAVFGAVNLAPPQISQIAFQGTINVGSHGVFL